MQAQILKKKKTNFQRTKQTIEIKPAFLMLQQHCKRFVFMGVLFAFLFFLLYIEPFVKIGKRGTVIKLAQGPTYC